MFIKSNDDNIRLLYNKNIKKIQLLFAEKDCRRKCILEGSNGADYFYCGEETDVVIDLKITENDDNTDNCEVIMGSEVIMIR